MRLIDIAFITTIERKLRGNTAKIPVKSFNYFIPEIENLLEQKKTGDLPIGIDEYHRYALSVWEKSIRKLRDQLWGHSTTTK